MFKFFSSYQKKYSQDYVRFLTTWTTTDLPLLPRVAFAHQNLTKALEKNKYLISPSFYNEFSEALKEVRAVNWNVYNSDNLDYNAMLLVKVKLENLILFETKLPEVLTKEIATYAIFPSLKSAITCLEARAMAPSPRPY